MPSPGARILDLLADIVAARGLGLLLVTHDMGVVARLAHHVTVMENGRLVEHCDVNTLFSARGTRSASACWPRIWRYTVWRKHHEFTQRYRGESRLSSPRQGPACDPSRHRPRRNGGPARTQRLWEKHHARMLVGLETPQHGDIARRGTPLAALKGEAIGAFRRDIQLVFQDAFSAVNPRKTVREIVSEPLRHLLRLSREARARGGWKRCCWPSTSRRRCSISARRSSAADSCSASARHAPRRYGRSC